MGVLINIGSATGAFLDEFFSLDRFQRAGARLGVLGEAVAGGVLALAAPAVRALGRRAPALLRRGARAARELQAANLLALGIAAAAAALLIRSKVLQLLSLGGLLLVAGLLHRKKEKDQRRLVQLLVAMDEERRRAFVEAANRGDVAAARELLTRTS